MTLGRKILFRSLSVFAGLILLGAVALWGMLSMSASVYTASEEFRELRNIEAVRIDVAVARSEFSAPDPELPAVAELLNRAIAGLERFRAGQTEGSEGSQTHENSETRAVQSGLSQLRDVLGHAGATPSGASDAGREADVRQLESVERQLAGLAREADALVAKTQQRAERHLRRGTTAVIIAFALIALGAVVISVQQYRSIMAPLEAVRQAVRTIASGRFEQRVAVRGEREFDELAQDVNQMADELHNLYRTLEEKVEAKSRELVQSERLASLGFLAAGVAHEINNPLGIMAGFAELSLKNLRARSGDESRALLDDAQRSLQIIRDEAFRCRDITEKLLSLARPGAGGRRERVDIASAIDDVAGMVRAHRQYQDRSLSVFSDSSATGPLVVLASPAEIKQVLLNVIVNGLEATAPGLGRVSIRATRIDGVVEIRFDDNGCGMSADVCRRVFEPFYSTRRNESRGIGLGLSISKAIIESYGGTISARSDGVGQGSTFVVRLPSADTKPVNAMTDSRLVEARS